MNRLQGMWAGILGCFYPSSSRSANFEVSVFFQRIYMRCHSTVLENRKRHVKRTAPKLPILKRPVCYINNQNFKVKDNCLEFPMMVGGKCKRISVSCTMTQRQKDLFANTPKYGTLRLVIKNGNLCAQIIYEAEEQTSTGEHVMGIDLGIKVPAVSYCDNGKVKFYGNGRKNKYMKRFFRYQRKKLQKMKKPEVVKRINNKEQRIMKDIDHKISHDIIETAVKHGVSVIKMEQLSNIRKTTRTSRKNNHSLHTWSFYRLAQYIEYKAKLAGITVEYVNPAYTSQTCPECGNRNHAKDRTYTCKCGYHKHRDIVGAINICASTELVGHRQAA